MPGDRYGDSANSKERRGAPEDPRRPGRGVVLSGAVTRQCSRQGCASPAVVTLSYEYRSSQVWLDRLSAERDPHGYDLCERHAATLRVPLGWHLADRCLLAPAYERLAG